MLKSGRIDSTQARTTVRAAAEASTLETDDTSSKHVVDGLVCLPQAHCIRLQASQGKSRIV
jgi:hypothetical protein